MKTPEPQSANYPLPPYGKLNESYQTILKEFSVFPPDWRGATGTSGASEQQWIDCRTRTLELIHKVLWPAFDTNGTWIGPSTSFMNELTETDIRLLLDIRKRKLLDTRIDPPKASDAPTHRQLFEDEDNGKAAFGSNYSSQYDAVLEYRLAERIRDLFSTGLTTKCSRASVPLQFKEVLQRPRAFQIAFLTGHRDFTYEEAESADTPSMCSGHCLQGAIGVGAVIERFLLDNEKLKPDNWLALEQYAVDIGDRRVLAGVHYPSDNICSWLILMRIADRVYRNPLVKQKLWHAITKRSLVYKEIQAWVKTGKGNVYNPSLSALKDAGEGKNTC
jgi:hypothetical protein